MMQLKEVCEANFWDILTLEVSESQQGFVASNMISLSEAYLVLKGGKAQVFPFGIYDADRLVGFVMIGFGKCWGNAPDIAEGNYNLWRLMIDKQYQRKGYGRKAIELAIQFVKSLSSTSSDYLWLSYEPENQVAKHLYSSLGFRETCDFDGGEVIAVLDLNKVC